MAPLSKQTVTIPIWLITIIIGLFIALIEFNVKLLYDRLDRIELKLDTHITNTKN